MAISEVCTLQFLSKTRTWHDNFSLFSLLVMVCYTVLRIAEPKKISIAKKLLNRKRFCSKVRICKIGRKFGNLWTTRATIEFPIIFLNLEIGRICSLQINVQLIPWFLTTGSTSCFFCRWFWILLIIRLISYSD